MACQPSKDGQSRRVWKPQGIWVAKTADRQDFIELGIGKQVLVVIEQPWYVVFSRYFIFLKNVYREAFISSLPSIFWFSFRGNQFLFEQRAFEIFYHPATLNGKRIIYIASQITNHVHHFRLQSVTLHTDLGDLKIEVFCEAVPKAAEVLVRNSTFPATVQIHR